VPQAPPEPQRGLYNIHQLNGISIYLPPSLLLNGPALLIGLAGFWRLRWLRVEGVAPAASSCAY